MNSSLFSIPKMILGRCTLLPRFLCAVLPFVISIVLLFIIASVVLAQSGSGYDLTWSTIDNGGGESSGSGYTLNGTIGQPDDASGALTGGGFTLTGGFWIGGVNQHQVYLPLVLR